MSSTLSEREIIISATFILLSANAFNLVKSKILLCGKKFKQSIIFFKWAAHKHVHVPLYFKVCNSSPNDEILDQYKFKAFA